jgi:hypothetical protein
MKAANRVARLRSPVIRQAIARAIRPPSRGKAGIRLKTKTTAFIVVNHPITAIGPETSAPSSITIASQSAPPPAASAPIPASAIAIASVTAGPAAAILNSVPAESESRVIRAMPPKNHRVMSEIGIPARIATKACPSSCRRIEAKNASALTTAST